MKKNKIIALDALSALVSKYKKSGKKVVHCHGVFDLMHIGHIKHFSEAKNQGDILIVTLTPDEYVNKGPNRPAFSIQHRLESIASLEDVDLVAENKWPTAEKTLSLIKPDIYFKGPDYKNYKDDITGNIKREVEAVKKCGGKIMYSDDETFSSSNLLNKYSDIFTKEQKDFISKISQSSKDSSIENILDSFKDKKVLVIGETIIDEYVFCEGLGKSGKESMLVLRELESSIFLGGASAVANHLADFCKRVDLVSCIGAKKEFKNFISSNLLPNIKAKYLYKEESPTILKKRFLDKNSKNKVLGVYSLNDDNLNINQEKELKKILSDKIKDFDLVIVVDYGHGFINENISKFISKNSNFLSLNAQINSSNSGFHSFNKYPKCNSVVINESELRHEMRSREGNLENLMVSLSKNLSSQFVVVTRGTQGAIIYNKKSKKFKQCPAFASKIVDKVGSGDAMLPIISLALEENIDENLSLLLGSLAAAQSVESISNSKRVSKQEILKTFHHALK